VRTGDRAVLLGQLEQIESALRERDLLNVAEPTDVISVGGARAMAAETVHLLLDAWAPARRVEAGGDGCQRAIEVLPVTLAPGAHSAIAAKSRKTRKRPSSSYQNLSATFRLSRNSSSSCRSPCSETHALVYNRVFRFSRSAGSNNQLAIGSVLRDEFGWATSQLVNR
jgi:hypothetical protein